MATIELGPGDGTLGVNTYKGGVASKAGHDLVIRVDMWSATIETSEHGAPTAMRLEADATSLQILEGNNGLKPLSDKDRAEIRKNIDEKVLKRQPIRFESASVQGTSDRVEVSGTLTMNGEDGPASFVLELSGGRLRGTAPITQSDWKIKPYSGLMGALKVRDEIEITIDAALPSG